MSGSPADATSGSASPPSPKMQAAAPQHNMENSRPAALHLSAAGSSPELASTCDGAASPSSPSRRRNNALQPLRIPVQLQRFTQADVVMNTSAVEGKGAYGKVVRGKIKRRDASTGGLVDEEVAVKIMSKAKLSMNSQFVNLQNELDIVAQLEHPCIINTLACFEDDEYIYIVMELAEQGELYKYTKDIGMEDMHIVAPKFVAEALLGLEYMASKGLCHRDVKPENLLLTSGFHVKIADFGTVCVVNSPENGFAGTPTYVSPEMLATSKASSSSDIWALGCVLFHLFVGRSPFQAETDHLCMEAVKARRIEWPLENYFPKDARDLVEKMLEMDPAKRIGFADIKRHPFFRPVNWDTLLQQSNETFLNANFTALYKSHLLSSEKVVYAALVIKRRYKGLSCHPRILVLTDYPQLFYLDPAQQTLKKGKVPWDAKLCAEADSDTLFHCHTSGSRTYHFEDRSGRAHLWAAKINHLVRTKRTGGK